MTRKSSLVIEGSPGGEGAPGGAGDLTGCSAYVPELPTILVTGRSIEELTARAADAIRVHRDTVQADRPPTSTLREIEVELPA